ncbi:NlpC/P60 family protein [Lentzea sp. NPDC058436]|uniref:NlpC/P60 family protein n=1 Tax=Lentzea sp. NPDC058436 TaxID=3346499 RepID=UPI0036545078
MRIRHALAATAISLGLLGGMSGIAQAAPEGPAQQEVALSQVEAAAGYGGSISRTEVIKRAKDWWDRKVPYSQSAYAWDVNKGKKYRTDCSGFVSMTWKLTTSRNTRNLHEVATKISWANLKPGDMILRNGHVKLFEKWANSAKTSAWIYEEGSTATDMDHETVTVSSLKSGGYAPWKYNKITG